MKNELRIGNWVYHNPNIWSYRNDDGVISNYGEFNSDCFQWEESDWYAIGECTLDFEKCIKPIQLTEEWLVKFGFKKHHISHIVYELNGTALAVKIWEDQFICFWGRTSTKSEIKHVTLNVNKTTTNSNKNTQKCWICWNYL